MVALSVVAVLGVVVCVLPPVCALGWLDGHVDAVQVVVCGALGRGAAHAWSLIIVWMPEMGAAVVAVHGGLHEDGGLALHCESSTFVVWVVAPRLDVLQLEGGVVTSLRCQCRWKSRGY